MQNQPEPIELLGTSEQQGLTSDGLSDSGNNQWLQSGLLLLGVSLMTWIMMRMYIRRRKRVAITTGTPHERLETIRNQAKKRSQLEGFGADVHELVQRLATQLDAKAARIEMLLEDADERIRKLERLERLERTRPETAPEPEDEEAADPVMNRVYELADQGEQAVEIAKQLNQHVGQVELILALRRA